MNKQKLFSLLLPAGSFRLRKSFLITVAILLLLSGIIVYYSFIVEERDRVATIDIGNEIVEALQAYTKDYGKYPDLLDELVPEYLKEIKKPLWGTSGWVYDWNSTHISLKVGYKTHEQLYPLMIYDPEHGWVYDT